ncbi:MULTISPECIES: Npun_R2479 family HD domain-containing metalloprotein [Cyanophyceae]|uniref:Npun_R2479 family HD domain-containing metalloprotein n=1 Tax=Cyanophyceae TaxID=3028117 RepID=UPI001682F182|nr:MULTISPECIES: Npun_R2479 family HD domain-containing metalloprotein [unclassified Trichocoleus]MBD1931725.1 metal-dependent phosphohydrolase [Trichocoleus sp. FACHB-69]MBD2006457.1 metal-dependent phosphohydrolase [Trichocoleus sp. FACHB-40]
MFNPTTVMIDTFVECLRAGYRRTYGGLKPDYADIIAWAGNMALENIANSDALYHNVEHTIYVTLVGQEVLRGKQIREGRVYCEDWLHAIISLLCHDIGYVKGVCLADRNSERLYATGVNGTMVSLPPGLTDASLTPYHVDRGKQFIEERFGGHKLIDAEVIKRNIELTRFPVPADEDHQDTTNFPGLIRAADLIGQMSDPRYLQKISALFYEFEETGVNKDLGYRNPGDLRRNYPKFYWNVVFPYIQTGLDFLDVTQEGKQILANLYANVFRVEYESPVAHKR